MKKINLLKIVILLIAFSGINKISIGQSPALPFNIGWQKLYGGSNDEENDYRGHTIANSTDGGYFFIGTTKSNDGDVSGNHGKTDVWVVKIDGFGNILWQRCIGGNQDEDGRFVISTSDGGCLVGGQTNSNNGDIKGNHGGSNDAFVVKLSSIGNVEWERTAGSNKEDSFEDVFQNADGSYLIAGYTFGNSGDVSGNHGGQDVWVVKISQTGNIVWQKCYGGSGDDGAHHRTKIISCAEGGYMLATQVASPDGDVTGFHGVAGVDTGDGWLVKLDDAGNIQWNKCYGSANWEYFENVTQLSNGDYITSGASHGAGGDIPTINGGTDWWVAKISQSGNLLWSRIYGGLGDEALHGKIFQLANGDLVMPSGTRSNDQNCIGASGLPDVWIVKTDLLGNILSYNLFGGPGYENTTFSVMNSDGSLTVCATSDPTDLSVTSTGNHDANSQLWILHLLANPADTFAITTSSLSQSSQCLSASPSNLSVSYSKRGTFKGNNIFTAELSDANGSFASPVIVGSIHSSSAGIISCTIPGNLPGGDHYAIRIRSSNPAYTGITSGHLLSIQPCSLTKSNNAIHEFERSDKPFSLHVFPNPVSNLATISFSIQQAGNVSLTLFDIEGRVIKIISSRIFETGNQQIKLNTYDLRTGVYLLKMKTVNYSAIQKILIIN